MEHVITTVRARICPPDEHVYKPFYNKWRGEIRLSGYLCGVCRSYKPIDKPPKPPKPPKLPKPIKPKRDKKVSDTFSPKLRWQVMERDGHKCVKCGRSASDGVKLHVDHIYPKSRGGMATLDNGQTLCNECNIGKGARVPETHPTKRAPDRLRRGRAAANPLQASLFADDLPATHGGR